MKRILFIMPSLPGGGAEKVLFDLVRSLDKKKYQIDVFSFENEGLFVDEIKKYVNEMKFLFNKKRPNINKINFFRKVISLIRRPKLIFLRKGIIDPVKKNYDIEISFLEGWATEYLANRKSDSKKIGWVHIDLEKHRMLSKNIEQKSYEKIDEIVCVSEDSKRSLLNLYPEFKNKTEVIYNPILKSEILEKSLEKVEEINDGSKITLITSGRLSYQKGYDILLNAHKELLEEGLDYNLKILGEGPLKIKLQKYINKNKIRKNTELLGFKTNPYAYIKQGDIYIMSSRYEGYPLVLAEALTLKMPVVSTKCTGPIEMLDNGKYGLMAECEDVNSLKENIKKLIVDKNLRIKLKKLSEERSNIFDAENIIKQVEMLFDRESDSGK